MFNFFKKSSKNLKKSLDIPLNGWYNVIKIKKGDHKNDKR